MFPFYPGDRATVKCKVKSNYSHPSVTNVQNRSQGDRQARTGQGSQARVARARLGQPGQGINQRRGIQYVKRRAVHQMIRCTAWSVLYGRSRGERTP